MNLKNISQTYFKTHTRRRVGDTKDFTIEESNGQDDIDARIEGKNALYTSYYEDGRKLYEVYFRWR